MGVSSSTVLPSPRLTLENEDLSVQLCCRHELKHGGSTNLGSYRSGDSDYNGLTEWALEEFVPPRYSTATSFL